MLRDDHSADPWREAEHGDERRNGERQGRKRPKNRGTGPGMKALEQRPSETVRAYGGEREREPAARERRESHGGRHLRSLPRFAAVAVSSSSSFGSASPTSSTNPEITGSSSPSARRFATLRISVAIKLSRLTIAE